MREKINDLSYFDKNYATHLIAEERKDWYNENLYKYMHQKNLADPEYIKHEDNPRFHMRHPANESEDIDVYIARHHLLYQFNNRVNRYGEPLSEEFFNESKVYPTEMKEFIQELEKLEPEEFQHLFYVLKAMNQRK